MTGERKDMSEERWNTTSESRPVGSRTGRRWTTDDAWMLGLDLALAWSFLMLLVTYVPDVRPRAMAIVSWTCVAVSAIAAWRAIRARRSSRWLHFAWQSGAGLILTVCANT